MQQKGLTNARKVHALMVSNRLDSIPVLGDHLIRLFTLCGSLSDAYDVFNNVSKPTVYTWNAIIQAHTNLGNGQRALQLYGAMQADGIEPESYTLSSVLKACVSISSLQHGRLIHDKVSRNASCLDVAVGNALVNMYAKCGSLEEAQRVFDNLSYRNIVSWAAMISGYVQYGQADICYNMFERMQVLGTKPDKVILLCALKACGSMEVLEKGRLVHSQILEIGLESDSTICNALVDMYGKCGALDEAATLFDKQSDQDLVAWSTLIAGCAQHGHGSYALHLFTKMQVEGVKPDKMVFSSIVKACESLAMLRQGRYVYNQVILAGFESDVVVGSTLVDMFANNASLDEAQRVFDRMPHRDVISWGAMIAALLNHGDTCLAFEHFGKLLTEGLVPERATMLSVMKACATMGALKQFRILHDKIFRCGLDLEVTIGNMAVDVYAKCGSLEEAYRMFTRLPFKTVVSWGALITAYAKGGEWRFALDWFEYFKTQGIKSDEVIYLGVLIACSNGGLLEEGYAHFKSMIEEHGIAPTLEHFNCLVDIVGRAGLLMEAEDVLRSIPLGMDIIGWTSLLIGCETYSNTELGERCHQQIKRLDPNYL